MYALWNFQTKFETHNEVKQIKCRYKYFVRAIGETNAFGTIKVRINYGLAIKKRIKLSY